jgi:uncharacterized membrane protein
MQCTIVPNISIYLFIHGLFNDAVNSTVLIVLNVTRISEQLSVFLSVLFYEAVNC